MSWQNAACVTALSLNALHLHAQSMLTHTPRRLRRNIVAVRTEAIRARREADQAGDARAALAAERATHAATRAKLAELERQRSGHADGAAGGGHGFCHCGAARAARHLSSAVARASAVRTELVAGLRPLPAVRVRLRWAHAVVWSPR